MCRLYAPTGAVSYDDDDDIIETMLILENVLSVGKLQYSHIHILKTSRSTFLFYFEIQIYLVIYWMWDWIPDWIPVLQYGKYHLICYFVTFEILDVNLYSILLMNK